MISQVFMLFATKKSELGHTQYDVGDLPWLSHHTVLSLKEFLFYIALESKAEVVNSLGPCERVIKKTPFCLPNFPTFWNCCRPPSSAQNSKLSQSPSQGDTPLLSQEKATIALLYPEPLNRPRAGISSIPYNHQWGKANRTNWECL